MALAWICAMFVSLGSSLVPYFSREGLIMAFILGMLRISLNMNIGNKIVELRKALNCPFYRGAYTLTFHGLQNRINKIG